MVVIQEAYVAGVSTRKMDQVVESLGLRVSKSEVSGVCQGLLARPGPLALYSSRGWGLLIDTRARGRSLALAPPGPKPRNHVAGWGSL